MPINWIAVARDVSIVFGLVLVSSFVAAQLIQAQGEEVTALVIGLSNIFWGTVGFAISGCLAKTQRFKHLFIVAIGLWLVSFVNVAMGLTRVQVWVAGFLLILLMMGLGGGLSYLFVRTPQAEPSSQPTPPTE
ncbi:MAG: hypothetical protein HY444_07015 [Nitrospirae bacterium]|nr:hypothetical protein [Nitrospirota bacterium]